jgi:hypothetical protein
MMSTFLSEVDEIFKQRDWVKEVSPASLLKDWTLFVEECEKGYSDNIYEYYNDIRVREWIELILSAPELQIYPEIQEFASNVSDIDQKFRKLLRSDVSLPKLVWWEQGVLQYAGRELKNDLLDLYDIEIEKKE